MGYVYLIRNGDLHKIGRTDNLEQRMKQLQPDEVVQVLPTDRSHDIELELHRKLKQYRLPQTEYFRLTEENVNMARLRLGWNPDEVPSLPVPHDEVFSLPLPHYLGSAEAIAKNDGVTALRYGAFAAASFLLLFQVDERWNLLPLLALIATGFFALVYSAIFIFSIVKYVFLWCYHATRSKVHWLWRDLKPAFGGGDPLLIHLSAPIACLSLALAPITHLYSLWLLFAWGLFCWWAAVEES